MKETEVTVDEKKVTISMSEKEWEQVFYALITYEGFAKVARIRIPEKRQAALIDMWWRTQLLLKALYKPRVAKDATTVIGRAIGDDWPMEATYEVHRR